MATYLEMFGSTPSMARHAVERMNEVGISPAQLTVALVSQAMPGTSPDTIMFVGGGVTTVVEEHTGRIITVW
jgi:hypothetical protein